MVERLECSFASQEAKLDRLLAMMTSNLPQQPSKLQQPSRQLQFSTPDLNCQRQSSLELPFTPPQRTTSHPDAVSVSFTSSLADPDRVLDHFDDFMRHSQQDFTGTCMYFKCLVTVNVTYWKCKSVWSCIMFFQGVIHGFSSCLVVISVTEVYMYTLFL